MKQHTPPAPSPQRDSGFSLVELLVSMAVAALLLTGVLAAFNLNSQLARVQTHVAEMQQSSRISQFEVTRFARMTGRGGIPDDLAWDSVTQTFDGLAFELRNNVANGTQVGDGDSPEVVEETDILTLRGVFTSPIYQISPSNGSIDPSATSGRIRINALSPSGIPQNLESLAEAVLAAEGGVNDAVILTSSVGTNYVILELTGGAVETGGDDDETVFVEFDWNRTGGRTANYLALSPNGVFPPTMTHVVYVGLLEEYRYYVRENDDGPSPLSRGRFYPGTDNPWGDVDANAQEDIADNILDFQVALGIEDASDIGDVLDADEWLGDDENDDPADLMWTGGAPYYVRVSTLARTNRPDPKYVDPAIDAIEDHDYDETAGVPTDETELLQRNHRRKLLQNVIDLRNLG